MVDAVSFEVDLSGIFVDFLVCPAKKLKNPLVFFDMCPGFSTMDFDPLNCSVTVWTAIERSFSLRLGHCRGFTAWMGHCLRQPIRSQCIANTIKVNSAFHPSGDGRC